MGMFKSCDKLPFTISIQFYKSDVNSLADILEANCLDNRISNHLTLKYLGYEEELTEYTLKIILSKLQEQFKYEKKKLEINS